MVSDHFDFIAVVSKLTTYLRETFSTPCIVVVCSWCSKFRKRMVVFGQFDKQTVRVANMKLLEVSLLHR